MEIFLVRIAQVTALCPVLQEIVTMERLSAINAMALDSTNGDVQIVEVQDRYDEYWGSRKPHRVGEYIIVSIMENFKLSNLRELSTEEQLRLNGGVGATASCSCGTCNCSCTQESPSATVHDVTEGAQNAVKDAKK